MEEKLTVRHPACGHTWEVAGPEGLPPSARKASDGSTHEVADKVDCPRCNPPATMPDL